VKGDIEEVPH